MSRSKDIFISPKTGKMLLKKDHIFVGDDQGHSAQSTALIDISSEISAIKDSTFILQTPNENLPNAQALNVLNDGILKHRDGVVEIASLGDGQIFKGDHDGNIVASNDLKNLWNALDASINIGSDQRQQLPVPEKVQKTFEAFDNIVISSPEEPSVLVEDTDKKVEAFFDSFQTSIQTENDDLGQKISGVFNAFNDSITLYSSPRLILRDGQSVIVRASIEDTAEKIKSVFSAFDNSIKTAGSSISSTADKISGVFDAFNRSIEGVGATADKISGVFDAFNKSIEGVGSTADKISGVFDAFNNSITTAEGAFGRTADKITSVFKAFDKSIEGVGTTADKISGVFDAFTNAVNSVGSLSGNIRDTATAITDVFSGFTTLSVSLSSLAEKAGYNFAKGFVLGAFVDDFITYRDVANSIVNIDGDVKGTGYITVPRFNIFTPGSWWSHTIDVSLQDTIFAKTGRAINFIFDNAMPYGKFGDRTTSSSAFNVCSTDTGSNWWSRDVRPASIGLMSYNPDGDDEYQQKGYCFRAEFSYSDDTAGAKSNDDLYVKKFGLYYANTKRTKETKEFLTGGRHKARIISESMTPLFELKSKDSDEPFTFYRALTFNTPKNIKNVKNPVNGADAVPKDFMVDYVNDAAPNQAIKDYVAQYVATHSGGSLHSLWDTKMSARDQDHDGWILWSSGRSLPKTTYQTFWDNMPASLLTKGLVTDGDTTFTLNDIAGRYLGIAGSGLGLTPRVVGDKIGAESITNVPLHAHTMNHTHTATSDSYSHNHTMNHSHSINHDHISFSSGANNVSLAHTHNMNHDHPSFSSDSNTHAHSLAYTGSGDIIILNRATSGGGYVDYSGSGGAGPHKTSASYQLNKSVATHTHNHRIDVPLFGGSTGAANVTLQHFHSVDVPSFSGTSGAASQATTTLNSHSHTLTVNACNDQTGSSGKSSVNVMNPGVFFNLFVYTGVIV